MKSRGFLSIKNAWGKFRQLQPFLTEYYRDLIKCLRYSSYSPFEDRQKRLFYQIIIAAHSVEKGLSLNNPRALFGRGKITELMTLAQRYDPSAYGAFPLEMTLGALEHYLALHADQKVESEFLNQIVAWRDRLLSKSAARATGGTRVIPSNHADIHRSHSEFLGSRFSCRAYLPKPVTPEMVAKIVTTAQSAPSQCNRQSTRVHCYQNREQIVELLTIQRGGAAFAELVCNLFLVTSELTAWEGAGQRSQAYVDGALFAMALMYACQSYGIASCPLTLAFTNQKEQTIQKVAGIHPRERLVMMIAFGYPIDANLRAAASPRLPIDQVLTLHR